MLHETFLPSNQLYEPIHQGLRNMQTVGKEPDKILCSMLLVQDKLKDKRATNLEALRLAINQMLDDGLDALRQKDARSAEILHKRYKLDEKAIKVAKSFTMSVDQLTHLQREAIRQLAQILWEREIILRADRAPQYEVDLPLATYSRLIGFDQALETVVKSLLAEDEHPVVVVSGLGGAGKTALADAATRRVIRAFHFDRVIWHKVASHSLSKAPASLEQIFEAVMSDLAKKLFPKWQGNGIAQEIVQKYLKETPTLVILDNLEYQLDALSYLETLRGMAGASKFLLTSRGYPHKDSQVYHYPLLALTLEDTGDLIRHQARTNGLKGLAAADKKEVQEMYQMTGGNPLAIKLVVGLLKTYSLNRIIATFNQKTSQEVNDISQMYLHIYQQAWKALSPIAQTVLRAMPLTPETGTDDLEQLVASTGLSLKAVETALIDELIPRSLVEVMGTIYETKYGIHGLTRSFLNVEINRWELNTDPSATHGPTDGNPA